MKVENILTGPAIVPWRSVLLCGPSGSMKTITSSMFPEPQCWIASNPGQMCGFPLITWEKLKRCSDNYVIKAPNVPYSQIMEFIDRNMSNFKTWIVDDITYLQHVFLAERKGSKAKATYDDWGFILEYSRDIIKVLSEVSGHLVVIALEQLMKDEVQGQIIGLPHVFGKFAHELPAMVRTALHITAQPVPKKEPRRFVSASPELFWSWCKDREGLLSPQEEHPDWVTKFLREGEQSCQEQSESAQNVTAL